MFHAHLQRVQEPLWARAVIVMILSHTYSCLLMSSKQSVLQGKWKWEQGCLIYFLSFIFLNFPLHEHIFRCCCFFYPFGIAFFWMVSIFIGWCCSWLLLVLFFLQLPASRTLSILIFVAFYYTVYFGSGRCIHPMNIKTTFAHGHLKEATVVMGHSGQWQQLVLCKIVNTNVRITAITV